MRLRWMQAGLGALAGLVLWGLIEVADRGNLTDRALLVLFAFFGTFFATCLVMAGPLTMRRAVLRAIVIGMLAGVLSLAVSQRFATVEETFNSVYPALALLAVVLLPVPFVIAQDGPGWRDYPTLFEGSWSLVVRTVVAQLFTAIIWGVIVLSDGLLNIVGIGLIGQIAYEGFAPFVITGAGFGLALAVVDELRDQIQARLVVRLVRLLAPAVLAVSAIFLLVAPVRGLSNLFEAWSAAGVLMAMAVAALSFLTLVVDRDDTVAPTSPVLQWSARGLSLVLPVLSGLALWAVIVRVNQYGWTPDRLFAALSAGLLLAYGLWHALSVLRGAGWMARIRSGNLKMALVVLAVAALWLTPVLNAERISAASQEARIMAGETRDQNDLSALSQWGKAGAAATERLQAAAKEPGGEALAEWLAQSGSSDTASGPSEEEERQALIAGIVPIMPVQPASATGTRDSYLLLMQTYELRNLAEACRRSLPGGGAGCLMVVADLLPEYPGEEVILGLTMDGWAAMDGLMMRDNAILRQGMRRVDGTYLETDDILRLMEDWQVAPPPVAPVRLNQLGTGENGVFMTP